MPVQTKCIQCEKEFLVKPYQVELRKFCSTKCKNDHHRVSLNCEKCGDPFWAFKSSVESQSRRFCSMSCRMAVTGKQEKPKKERVKIIKVCKTCGVEFRVPPVRKDTAQYCSHKCKGADSEFKNKCSEPQRGEKSPRWTGGVYQRSSGYKRFRDRDENGLLSVAVHRMYMVGAILKENPAHPFLHLHNGNIMLRPEIHVHHIDRVRGNNDISNLLAVTADAHHRIHSNGTKPKPWECFPSNPEKW